jgi:hypothetical protein
MMNDWYCFEEANCLNEAEMRNNRIKGSRQSVSSFKQLAAHLEISQTKVSRVIN